LCRDIQRVWDENFQVYGVRKIWRQLKREGIDFATLEGVDGFNNRRRLEPIGGIPPARAEARYDAQIEGAAMAA
jgi:putative transposase